MSTESLDVFESPSGKSFRGSRGHAVNFELEEKVTELVETQKEMIVALRRIEDKLSSCGQYDDPLKKFIDETKPDDAWGEEQVIYTYLNIGHFPANSEPNLSSITIEKERQQLKVQHEERLQRCHYRPRPFQRQPSQKDRSLNVDDDLKSKTKQSKEDSLDDKRACLASAIQAHAQDITEKIVFKDSELPDLLVKEMCLTEDECGAARNLPKLKLQNRRLVLLIIGRDIRVLEQFLELIRLQNEKLYESIYITYAKYLQSGVKETSCALCLLKMHFDIGDAAEKLWSNNCIDNNLYRQIIFLDESESRIPLWNVLIRRINNSERENPESTFPHLLEAIKKKQTYSYLSSGLSEIQNRHRQLKCICKSEKRSVSSKVYRSSSGTYPSTSSRERSMSDSTVHTNNITIESEEQLGDISTVLHSETKVRKHFLTDTDNRNEAFSKMFDDSHKETVKHQGNSYDTLVERSDSHRRAADAAMAETYLEQIIDSVDKQFSNFIKEFTYKARLETIQTTDEIIDSAATTNFCEMAKPVPTKCEVTDKSENRKNVQTKRSHQPRFKTRPPMSGNPPKTPNKTCKTKQFTKRTFDHIHRKKQTNKSKRVPPWNGLPSEKRDSIAVYRSTRQLANSETETNAEKEDYDNSVKQETDAPRKGSVAKLVNFFQTISGSLIK